MKVGDGVPVTIAGQQVAQAVVKEMSDGVATLEFPATRVQMAYRVEIDTAPKPVESETHTEVLGVERPTVDDQVVTNVPVEGAEQAEQKTETPTPETKEQASDASETG